MKALRSSASIFVAFVSLAAGLFAAERHVTTAWDELIPVVSGKTAAVTLTEGVWVQGRVERMDGQALTVNIREASDFQRYPRGSHTIARESVSSVRYTANTNRWKAIGTLLGAGGGAAGGAVAAQRLNNEGASGKAAAAVAGLAGAGAAIGYFAGKAKDQETVVATIQR